MCLGIKCLQIQNKAQFVIIKDYTMMYIQNNSNVVLLQPHLLLINQFHKPLLMNSHLRPRQQFPFYKTYIDLQCRKDILVENEHVNKKVKAKMTPLMSKLQSKAKQNKLRLAYFFGFIVLFKMEPIYDYVFCKNKTINWIYNNIINYYTDFTNPIPQSALQTSKQAKVIGKSPEKKKLAELFYRIDKQPNNVIGYNYESGCFVNNPIHEISIDQYLELCEKNYHSNYSEIQLNMKNAFSDSLL